MFDALHPAQIEAVEKLKRLKVGALYIERQEGKLRTVSELIRFRLDTDRIDSVIWLCTRRKQQMIQAGIFRYLPEKQEKIVLVGVENLSHRLPLFLKLMQQAQAERVMLVIDNGLLIKNPRALRTQRVLALSGACGYKLLISDVPLTRSAADMFTQWYALDWRILGYQSYWGFCINHVDRNRRSKNLDYLARRIEPYCAQLLREDVQPVGGRREYVWRFRLPQQAAQEYARVAERFMLKAAYSQSGVYRMLQACQHAAGGRRIICDYPLRTENIYADPGDDPRLMSLLEILTHYEKERILILCRYACECDTVEEIVGWFHGSRNVGRYPASKDQRPTTPRIMVMNCFTDEREERRLQADVIIYYTSDWNWRKRQEKERQCQGALCEKELTVISLAAVNTIDEKILRSIWRKDNLIQEVQKELMQRRTASAAEERNAKDL